MLEEKKETLVSPGDALRQKLQERNWTQDDLAIITGKSRQSINAVALRKVKVSREMDAALCAAFGDPIGYWIKLDGVHPELEPDISKTKRLAELFSRAPIRDMQKRGWIKETASLTDLANELDLFLRPAVVATRSSAIDGLSSVQRAWCARARQLAEMLTVAPYRADRSDDLIAKLRDLAAYPKEVKFLPGVFAEFGIRFVVVEPLPGAKIDGAAFWIDDESPAIAVSVRYDRVDAFWHTVMHECSHIVHGDLISVDSDLVGERSQDFIATNEQEKRANREAADSLIPKHELDSFIRRVAPLYSKQRIIQFAHRIKIHPGIVVGQLQHRREISWSTNREMLVKVRATVIEAAFTDGWGNVITPSVFED
jgi:HTH-type transcriptional regulator / antitoxin HigA